ncbi:hypothetical protein L6270_00705 [Candidatus Parcubacteria bacterium]|nr:hypothetical protein [Patescibacteria group bacterium]MBU4309670.1 hypothetical protein [Patescibacteria group bacterium]MBU4432006.1 hypothetical protein [Patescibacteria group bacterium]MBU4577942.1 hypothetical protein [Patescibacteria group bacterium]MCG2696549.1 hypothetical protein [Candidatus Parcubacteria bacterium]
MEKLIVIKVGTNSIVTPGDRIRKKLLDNIAESVRVIRKYGYRVIIVSSGAISCGKIITKQALSDRAYAGIGQPSLMMHWQEAFAKVDLVTAQGLYVNNNLHKKKNRQSTTKILSELLMAGIIPIINENDFVTDAETKDLFGFGDNDQLASLIAIAKQAAYLFLLTTVDGVFSPETDLLISELHPYEKKIENSLQTWKGESNGGMISKVKNAKTFVRSVQKSEAIIASFKEANILFRAIIAKENIGTKIKRKFQR